MHTYVDHKYNGCILLMFTIFWVGVQSYKHKDAFIVTQNPMESTSDDFWQMIVERDCRVIVMLCPLQEDGQVLVSIWLV